VAKKLKKKTKTRKKKVVARRRPSRASRVRRAKRRLRGPGSVEPPVLPGPSGLGAMAAGQSGDIEGLPQGESVDSESVQELTEEGQDYEAEVVAGVEQARDPDQARVQTRRYIPPEER
jgi:hypothetical protein